MGHLINAKDEVYNALAERLSRAPEGARINEDFMAILHSLYTESEALVGSQFPLVPMTLNKMAEVTGIQEQELATILDEMSHKGLIIDIPRRDVVYYMLAPVVVGFFEYTFMRTGDQVRLKELAELFEKYFGQDGVAREIAGGETKIMRAMIYEKVIPLAVETEVLDYEQASEIIRKSGGGAISLCACRHKASHLGTACDAPQEVCMSLGGAAEWIIHKGLGKPATVDELLNVLDETTELGLVHLCDNVMNQPTYICSCCSCCCLMLRAISEHKVASVLPSNFIPCIEADACIGCGVCAESCKIGAITMSDIPVVDQAICIGCGVCAAACPTQAISMSRESVLHIPPATVKGKLVRMAKEKRQSQ